MLSLPSAHMVAQTPGEIAGAGQRAREGFDGTLLMKEWFSTEPAGKRIGHSDG